MKSINTSQVMMWDGFNDHIRRNCFVINNKLMVQLTKICMQNGIN